MIKKERKGLTQTNIFHKKKYQAILDLILHTSLNQRIRFIHLRYALVKNHGIDSKYEKNRIEKFFFTENDKKTLNRIKKDYEEKKISYNSYIKGTEIIKQGAIKRLKFHGLDLEEIKFKSIYGLRKALKTLKDFDIIKSEKPKKGYSYYVFTDIGLALYTKMQIHYLINTFVPNNYDYLVPIQNYIMAIIFDDKIKKGELKV